jgi:4-amino-4-deoxy-L-arabinose transferase-like glycosyltransferase
MDVQESNAAAATASRFRRRWLLSLLIVVMLGQMAAVMVVTSVQQTPTIDEPVYVGTAVSYLERQGLRYNTEHPPLGKLIMAAGLTFAQPRLGPAFRGNQGELGRHVLYEAGNDPYRLMFLARLPIILLTLLFGLVVFAFARDLAGPAAGVLSLALYTFSPDMITHGSLATLDVPAAGFLLTATWLLWRARQRPLPYLPLAGIALGAALATRMSVLPAVPVLLILAFLTQRRRRGIAAAAGVVAVALAAVWLTYLAVDPAWRGVQPTGIPPVTGLTGMLVDSVPVPQAYREGMRIQFAFENSTFSGFLFGTHYQGSLWYYLPAALLVKTPLGLLALWLAGTAILLAVPRLRLAALYLLVLPAVLLAVAMTGARDFGTRYVIFLPMFLAVAAGTVLIVQRRWVQLATAVLATFVAVSSLRTFPYYLPYSNEAFGGPVTTHRHLHDSNVDWGQDLGRLADRLRQRYPDEQLWLVYKGAGVPAAYGITASNPLTVPPADVKGLLVVSDSSIAKATGSLAELLHDSGDPIDDVGHSITIYRRP